MYRLGSKVCETIEYKLLPPLPLVISQFFYRGKKKSKRKAPISMERLEQIEKFLRAPPKPIERSNSMLKIVPPVERELRVSS